MTQKFVVMQGNSVGSLERLEEGIRRARNIPHGPNSSIGSIYAFAAFLLALKHHQIFRYLESVGKKARVGSF